MVPSSCEGRGASCEECVVLARGELDDTSSPGAAAYTGWLIALSYDISYTLCSPSEFHAKQIYVKNKAGLTGQTVPGRRIPGHWPTPVPEALAVAEPVTLVSKTIPFSFLPPPRAAATSACWPSSAGKRRA